MNEVKKSVKAELDQKQKELGIQDKLQHILLQIAELSNCSTAAEGIHLFVYCMSALVHYERYGGLNPAQIKDIISAAEATLKVFQIVPKKSKLAFLYGELAMISSQIYLKDGLFWRATWEQYVAVDQSGEQAPGGKPFIDLLFGIKFLRLGHCKRALAFFKEAEAGTPDVWKLARINHIRSLRLTGHRTLATDLIRQTRETGVSEDLLLELDWESACCRVSDNQNLDDLFKMVQRGASHYKASYVLEFFFWALSVQSYHWMSKTPKIRTLLRDDALSLKDHNFYYTIARDLEKIYDDNITLTTRIQNMGSVLEKLGQCHSVDKQLLIMAAAARWLLRNKIKDLFEVILLEYTALCEKMSQGRSYDLLGVLGDSDAIIETFKQDA